MILKKTRSGRCEATPTLFRPFSPMNSKGSESSTAFGGAHCFFAKRRFEPKISLAQTFFAKRSVIRSNFVQFCATFIQFWKGSSQSFCLCEREVDFFFERLLLQTVVLIFQNDIFLFNILV
jgi:hypothetical protein